jgi:hypothetical protein
MYDQRLFMKSLSRFSVVLPEHHDLDAAALAELTKSVTAVLGLGGSGVTMAEDGQLRFLTAVSHDSKELEPRRTIRKGRVGTPTKPVRLSG